MDKRAVLRTTTLYLSIIAVAVTTYLPAVDNFFISDDFGMLTYVQMLRQAPIRILEAPSEFFRLTSYLYFSACVWLFGPNSAAFYWTGIALHALVSVLVYVLVLLVTRKRVAAWSAAVFFAAYERHQEAIMWISAANETLVTLFCLLFLILWLRPTSWNRKLAPIKLACGVVFKRTGGFSGATCHWVIGIEWQILARGVTRGFFGFSDYRSVHRIVALLFDQQRICDLPLLCIKLSFLSRLRACVDAPTLGCITFCRRSVYLET